MNRLWVIVSFLLIIAACTKDPYNFPSEDCEIFNEVYAPEGYNLKLLSKIDFNGYVDEIQFINDEEGYAMVGNNVGGYVEVFKTIDGGETWTDLEISFDNSSRAMQFKNEDFGIISIFESRGCSSNCIYTCALLITEDGGASWKKREYTDLKRYFSELHYDNEGNLYGCLHGSEGQVIMKSVDDAQSWDTLFTNEKTVMNEEIRNLIEVNEHLYLTDIEERIYKVDTEGELVEILDPPEVVKIFQIEELNEQSVAYAGIGSSYMTEDNGNSWRMLSDHSSRIIDFQSPKEAVMIQRDDLCVDYDVFYRYDVIAITNNGGQDWNKSAQSSSLYTQFNGSYTRSDGSWLIMLGNELYRLSKE